MHEILKLEASVQPDFPHNELGDLSDAFFSLVESAWIEADRRAGVRYFLTRLLVHLPAEECVVYLTDGAPATLRRAHSSARIEDIPHSDPQPNSPIIENVLRTGTVYLNNDFD